MCMVISELEQAWNAAKPRSIYGVSKKHWSPSPSDTGQSNFFTKRKVETIDFQLTPDEGDFYDELTRYVESINPCAAR